MSSAHDQYYDEDRRRWVESDLDEWNPFWSDEDDQRDRAEEAYNQWLMEGGDL